MSREAMWSRVRMAWEMLAGKPRRAAVPQRPRERQAPKGDEPPTSQAGFAEEALPWLDAVYRFALRLTGGDRDASEDLVQDTFLRAHRAWHSYERGTNAKSWLFTICRNTYLHEKERARSRKERPSADFEAGLEALASVPAFEKPASDPERQFFDRLIDDQVVEAIDALPEEFREVLVLSDLGDLNDPQEHERDDTLRARAVPLMGVPGR